MILIIDNYDSFTYNLFQYLSELGEDVLVRKNDKITLKEIRQLEPKFIIISPGPCSPVEAGISVEVVKQFQGSIPILGICLGHQTIAYVYGSDIVPALRPVHGKVVPIIHQNRGVFRNLNNPLYVTRYHSLVIDKKTLSNDLEIIAESYEGEIMGIRHKEFLIQGVQFHPEALLTEQGHDLLKNFILLI